MLLRERARCGVELEYEWNAQKIGDLFSNSLLANIRQKGKRIEIVRITTYNKHVVITSYNLYNIKQECVTYIIDSAN